MSYQRVARRNDKNPCTNAQMEMQARPEHANRTAIQSTEDGLDMPTDGTSEKDRPAAQVLSEDNPTAEEKSTEEQDKDVKQFCNDQVPSPALADQDVAMPALTTMRPISVLDSDYNKDEDEDFEEKLRILFCPKPTDHEKREKDLASEVVARRRELSRKSKKRNLKRKTRSSVKKRSSEIPRFHSSEAQKKISIEASLDEIDLDIVQIFGIDPTDDMEVDKIGKERQLLGMKRKRSAEPSTDDIENGIKKKTMSPNAPKTNSNTMVTRSKTSGLRKAGNAISAVDKEEAGINAGKSNDCVSKMFRKHPDRKGWLECTVCGIAVWPPNMNKHVTWTHRTSV